MGNGKWEIRCEIYDKKQIEKSIHGYKSELAKNE